MKIAIFHNYMDNIGGAEKSTLIMARELDADIYTTNINKETIGKLGFSTKNIHSIGRVPINAPYRQQVTQLRFRHSRLPKKYDYYIISGDWALSASVRHKPNIWYIYSPPRELWDLYERTRKETVPFHARYIFDIWVMYNRHLIRSYIKHVSLFMPISRNVRERINTFLSIDGEVNYPPTDTSRYLFKKNGDFWLSVNRLIDHKRVDIQLRAFERLPHEKLVIVGSYEESVHFQRYAHYINSIKPKNVTILHWVNDKELLDLYASCRGFITTSLDEDFGLTPIEAMASGKLVIAPNEGGYKETINSGVTGVLIKDINAEKLAGEIKKISSNVHAYKDECIKQAKKFDTASFVEKIKKAQHNLKK